MELGSFDKLLEIDSFFPLKVTHLAIVGQNEKWWNSINYGIPFEEHEAESNGIIASDQE